MHIKVGRQLLYALAAGIALVSAEGISFAAGFESIRGSIFKVRTVSQEPDYTTPWRHLSQRTGSGTGFYIGENKILTNAHVVAQGRYVTVEREGDARQVPVDVKFIAHDADLALLTIPSAADQNILKGTRPLKFGFLPALHSPVTTVGYPMGGEQISITQGIVSRISFSYYSHAGDRQHLLVQVDSAINPGNSGGPVFQDGDVVGVAFQSYTAAENTGYIIPTPVVQRFLKDIEDGRYDGHPEDGVLVQPDALQNVAARDYYGVSSSQGVPVIDVLSHVAAFGKVKPGDILVGIDGHAIGYDGRISYEGERIDFDIIYDLAQIGQTVTFDVIRDGKPQRVDVKAEKSRPAYSQGNSYPRRPKFITWGGLVFTALSRGYLQTWGKSWYQKAPLTLRYLHRFAHYHPRFRNSGGIVVVSGRLSHSVNTYARDRETSVVESVDGVQIDSLEGFAAALEKAQGEFVRINLFERDDLIIIPRKEAIASQGSILKRYAVEPDRWLQGPEADGAIP